MIGTAAKYRGNLTGPIFIKFSAQMRLKRDTEHGLHSLYKIPQDRACGCIFRVPSTVMLSLCSMFFRPWFKSLHIPSTTCGSLITRDIFPSSKRDFSNLCYSGTYLASVKNSHSIGKRLWIRLRAQWARVGCQVWRRKETRLEDRSFESVKNGLLEIVYVIFGY